MTNDKSRKCAIRIRNQKIKNVVDDCKELLIKGENNDRLRRVVSAISADEEKDLESECVLTTSIVDIFEARSRTASTKVDLSRLFDLFNSTDQDIWCAIGNATAKSIPAVSDFRSFNGPMGKCIVLVTKSKKVTTQKESSAPTFELKPLDQSKEQDNADVVANSLRCQTLLKSLQEEKQVDLATLICKTVPIKAIENILDLAILIKDSKNKISITENAERKIIINSDEGAANNVNKKKQFVWSLNMKELKHISKQLPLTAEHAQPASPPPIPPTALVGNDEDGLRSTQNVKGTSSNKKQRTK